MTRARPSHLLGLVIHCIILITSSASLDVCNLDNNSSMYCTCEPASRTENTITCFIFGPLEPSEEVWTAFSEVEDVVAMTLTSRLSSQLQFIPVKALQALPLLQTLDIREASIGQLHPNSITNMTRLVTLLLNRNDISDMRPYSVSHLPKLKKIELSENHLSEILADSFVDLLELEALILDRNNITRIENCAFCHLHNLRELELWGNKITDLTEKTFLGLRYVHRLDLYKNHLRRLNPRVFQPMPRLRELDLKDNLIEHVSAKAFVGLSNLMSLQLNNNYLKTLPDRVFKDTPKLMMVDLSNNLLETFQVQVMEHMANTNEPFFIIYFKDNPLQCSCSLQWIVDYAESAQSQVFGRELRHVKCEIDGSDQKFKVLEIDCMLITPRSVATTQEMTSSSPSSFLHMEPIQRTPKSSASSKDMDTAFESTSPAPQWAFDDDSCSAIQISRILWAIVFCLAFRNCFK